MSQKIRINGLQKNRPKRCNENVTENHSKMLTQSFDQCCASKEPNRSSREKSQIKLNDNYSTAE